MTSNHVHPTPGGSHLAEQIRRRRHLPNMSSRAYACGGVLVPGEAPVISRYYEWYLGLMGEACRSTTK